MEIQVDMSSTAESTSTGDVRAPRVVLGKRSRERYRIYRNHSASLMMVITAAMNFPRRGEMALQMGSWRQEVPQRGPAVHLSSDPN